MICPTCRAANCRRSRRRSIIDFFASLYGSVPWRCARCNTRFRSRQLSLRHWLCAHCAICGNLDLKRISPDLINGFAASLWRLLGLPAFRCIPCRNKFFTLLPLSKETVEETEYKIAS